MINALQLIVTDYNKEKVKKYPVFICHDLLKQDWFYHGSKMVHYFARRDVSFSLPTSSEERIQIKRTASEIILS